MNRNAPATILAVLITSGIGLSIASAIPSASELVNATSSETTRFCESIPAAKQSRDGYWLCLEHYQTLRELSDDLAPELYTDTATAYLYN